VELNLTRQLFLLVQPRLMGLDPTNNLYIHSDVVIGAITFVPLEEQHGGNFDVILHEMAEDILMMTNNEGTGTRPESIERALERVTQRTTIQRII